MHMWHVVYSALLSPPRPIVVRVRHIKEGVLACWGRRCREAQSLGEVRLEGHRTHGVKEDIGAVREVRARDIAVGECGEKPEGDEG